MCCLSQGLVWFLDEESEVAMAFALLSLPCGWRKETTHTCPCSEQARQETKDENLESKHGQQSLEKAEEATA